MTQERLGRVQGPVVQVGDVTRFFAILAFALFLGQVTGVSSGGDAGRCVERCSDDDEKGNCAPDCADCACCSRPTSIGGVAPQVGVAINQVQIVFWADVQTPSSPEPGDIFHVPKLLA
jgi:hypothetical protein